MTNTDNYSFEVSLSTKAFDYKPDRNTEVRKLRFNRVTTTLDDFIISIIEGYCYAGVYPSESIGMTDKNQDDFLYSYLISIDIDHTQVTMNDMIGSIEYKPTFAYTTCNNGVEGDCRYRLVYCFNERVEGKEEYCNYVCSVIKAIDLEVKDVDKKSLYCSQYFNGNGTPGVEVYAADIIYSKEDFNKFYDDYYSLYIDSNKKDINGYRDKKDITDNKSVNQNHKYNNQDIMCLNDTFKTQFIDDFWNMRMEDVLAKYHDVYPNYEHTPFELPDEDTPLIYFPKGYTEIRRWWRVDKNGLPIKIKDGQGRRRKLFLNGILRRLIYPEITFDNLLYNLLYELCFYVSNYNAKNIIDKKEIFRIANNVMKEDITKYEGMRGSKREFIVNPTYCAKYGKNKRQVINETGKQKRDQAIGELYDLLLTDKENLKVMEENGLDISTSKLQRWKRENGISRYRRNKKINNCVS